MKAKDLYNALLVGGSGGGVTPTGTIDITQNGTVDVTQYASADVDVPNTYEESDEGKVVSSGALVPQTSRNITENGTVDTTLNNEVVVDVVGATVPFLHDLGDFFGEPKAASLTSLEVTIQANKKGKKCLLAIFHCNTITLSDNGFTLIKTQQNTQGGGTNISLYEKVLTSNESATVTITQASSTGLAACTFYVGKEVQISNTPTVQATDGTLSTDHFDFTFTPSNKVRFIVFNIPTWVDLISYPLSTYTRVGIRGLPANLTYGSYGSNNGLRFGAFFSLERTNNVRFTTSYNRTRCPSAEAYIFDTNLVLPEPSGSINITENGTYDVTDKATAVVDNAILRATLDNSVVSPFPDLVIPSDITVLRNVKFLRVNSVTGAEVTSINQSAMNGCSEITSVDFPKCTQLGESAIRDCSKLLSANLPLVDGIGNHNFRGCNALITLSLPKLTGTGTYCFNNANALTKLVIPKLEKVNNDCISIIPNIVNLSLPGCTNIRKGITNCALLENLFLPGSTICTLTDTGAFNNTPIKSGTGTIWVNDDLVDDYKAATNWVDYASQIKAISEYTGSYDYNEGVA